MPSRILPINSAPAVALRLMATPHRILISGDHRAYNLSMELATQAASGGRTVRFICGDNQFDPYQVARQARAAQLDDHRILQSILIARAFTAYQLYELVIRLDARVRDHLVIISNPCATFFDDDVPLPEAARFFYRMLWHVVDLTRQGLALLITQPPLTLNPRRSYFLTDLVRVADVVLHLRGEHSFALEQKFRAVLPQLVAADYRSEERWDGPFCLTAR